MAKKKSKKEMSGGQRTTAKLLGMVQIGLAVAAWRDLARRPAKQVNGSKAVWGMVIGINFIGPILYFTKGRSTTG